MGLLVFVDGSKVVGGGVFRCCVPWCGARGAAPADEADYALSDGSPHLDHEQFSKYFFTIFIYYLKFQCDKNISHYFFSLYILGIPI